MVQAQQDLLCGVKQLWTKPYKSLHRGVELRPSVTRGLLVWCVLKEITLTWVTRMK